MDTCSPILHMPSSPVLHNLPEYAQTHVHGVDDAIQTTHPLLPPSPPALNLFFFFLPSIFPSNRVFSNESAGRIRWPENWSFSFSISPSNEYSGLIDWFKLLAVQGTLKSLVQHHNSKTSITAVSINKNVTVISHCSPPK